MSLNIGGRGPVCSIAGNSTSEVGDINNPEPGKQISSLCILIPINMAPKIEPAALANSFVFGVDFNEHPEGSCLSQAFCRVSR